MPRSVCKKTLYLLALIALLSWSVSAAGFTGAFTAVLAQGKTGEETSGQAEKGKEEKVTVEIGGGTIVVDGETLSVGEIEGSERSITIIKREGGGAAAEEISESLKRGDIVKFGEKIKVEAGEKVRGSVVSIGGDVVVRGIVTQDAVSIGGDVYVSSEGEVAGSAVSVGGRVTREPGGKIGKEEVSVGPGWFPAFCVFGGGDSGEENHGPFIFSNLARFIMRVFWIGLVIAIGMGIVLLFPRQLEIVGEKVRQSPWKMGLAGFLAEILIVPVLVIVTVALAITIIGIPLLILVIPLCVLAIVAGFFFGYIGVANLAAQFVELRTGKRIESPYVRIALGVLLLMLAGLLSWVLRLGEGPLHYAGLFFGILSWMIFYLAATIGFGAVVASRFGTMKIRLVVGPTTTGTEGTEA